MKFIVLTGGPGAGKTAILEIARKQLAHDATILPEAASIIFGGGFWRIQTITARMAAQRAIYYVQREMENLVFQENIWKYALCDRGTIDGLAYWPRTKSLFWHELQTTQEREFSKYSAVIHLRTPSAALGYNNQNPIRIESATEAARIDSRIAEIWEKHPHYYQIPSTVNFLDKAKATLDLISSLISATELEMAPKEPPKTQMRDQRTH
jgi:predicted ATPase